MLKTIIIYKINIMKKVILLFLLIAFNNIHAQINEKAKEIKKYKITYIHESDYIEEMIEAKLDKSLMEKYYKKEDGELVPFFTSVEEAMANMRGFHERTFPENDNNQYEVYVLDDYCCGNNAGFPKSITLMSNNNINSEH